MASLQTRNVYDDSSDDEDEEEKAILASGPTFGSQPVNSQVNKSKTPAAIAETTPTVTQEEEDESDEGSPDDNSRVLQALQRKGMSPLEVSP